MISRNKESDSMEEVDVNDFDWTELNGKTLFIKVKETPDGHFVLGMDVNDTENFYILHWDLPNEGVEENDSQSTEVTCK